MELIVISSPTAVKKEASLINELFDAGLTIFHLRKPNSTGLEIANILKDIKPAYFSRISLHQHHQLTGNYPIQRLHFTEVERLKLSALKLEELKSKGFILTTSVHSQVDFENLNDHFDYSFVGPIFDSISKSDYKASKEKFVSVTVKSKHTKRIALGGICKENIQEIVEMDFDGAAFLGTIWNEPLKAVKKFQELKGIQEQIIQLELKNV